MCLQNFSGVTEGVRWVPATNLEKNAPFLKEYQIKTFLFVWPHFKTCYNDSQPIIQRQRLFNHNINRSSLVLSGSSSMEEA